MCKSSASKHSDARLTPRLLLLLASWAAVRDVTLRHTHADFLPVEARLSCLIRSGRDAIAIECQTPRPRSVTPVGLANMLNGAVAAEPSSSSSVGTSESLSARFSPSLSELRSAVHAAPHALLRHTLFLLSFSSFTALSAETRPLICTYKDALQTHFHPHPHFHPPLCCLCTSKR